LRLTCSINFVKVKDRVFIARNIGRDGNETRCAKIMRAIGWPDAKASTEPTTGAPQ
jgi:hypothetical protein